MVPSEAKVSSLELSVNIVRKEGYVVFRYQVDAEECKDLKHEVSMRFHQLVTRSCL